ncbi:MAG: LysR family transcriptional regulator [Enterovirga sp.]|nr:LysR family transcriptional regulator [Enterovirga sp.]
MPERREELEWGDLRFFLAVARAGTVSGAAKVLKVDHATVVRRVARLERDARIGLFVKRRSGYELTDAGQRLMKTGEIIEAAILAGQDDLTGTAYDLSGPVRIGAPDGFGSLYLPSRLADLAKTYPNLQIELVATARLFSLSRRDADMAITVALPETGRVLTRKLTTYRLGLHASRAYLDGNAPIRCRDDLLSHRFIGYIDELVFTPELDYLHHVHPGISAHFRSGNLVAQMSAAIQGIGIAVLPYFMTANVASLAPVLPGEVSMERDFWLLTHPDMARLARYRTVADFIADGVRADRKLFLGEPT